VLGIKEHLNPSGGQIRNRVADHRQVLFAGGAQHLFDVHRRRFSDDDSHGHSGLQQRRDAGVLLDGHSHPARAAEGSNTRVAERQVARAGKELGILGVGARPASLDVGYAQLIQLGRNANLVLYGKRDAFHLRTIAQGRIQDGYPFHHGVLLNPIAFGLDRWRASE